MLEKDVVKEAKNTVLLVLVLIICHSTSVYESGREVGIERSRELRGGRGSGDGDGVGWKDVERDGKGIWVHHGSGTTATPSTTKKHLQKERVGRQHRQC